MKIPLLKSSIDYINTLSEKYNFKHPFIERIIDLRSKTNDPTKYRDLSIVIILGIIDKSRLFLVVFFQVDKK